MNKYILALKTKIITLFSVFMLLCLFIPAKMYGNNAKVVKVAYYESKNFQHGATSDDDIKSGYSYEILQEISNYTGWKYEYVYGSYNDLLEKFKAGEIDLFAGMPYCSYYEQYMDLSNREIDTEYYSLFVGSEDESITTFESLIGKRIGLVRGRHYSEEFSRWAKENGLGFEFIYYDDQYNAQKDLLRDIIDGFIAIESSVEPSQEIKSFVRFGEDETFIAVAKDKSDVLGELNWAMAKIEYDNPDFYSFHKQRYFNKTNMVTSISLSEKEWILDHKILRIGYTDDYLPFSSTDESGNVTGVLKDIVLSWLLELNIWDSLQIEYIPYPGQTVMTEALNKGEVDIVFPIDDNAWYSEQTGIMTTEGIFNIPMSVVLKGEYSASSFNSIAVTRSKTVQQVYIKEHYPNAKIIFKNSGDECLQAVLSGEADCTIFTNVRLAGYLTKEEYKSLVSIPLQEGGATYCFGLMRGNIDLLSLLNRGISLIDKAQITESMYGYVENYSKYTARDFISEHIFLFLDISLAIIILIISGVWAYTRALKRNAKIKEEAEAEQREYFKILDALSRNFVDVYIIEPELDKSTPIKYKGQVIENSQRVSVSYKQTCIAFVKNDIVPDEQEDMLMAVDITNVIKKLEKEDEFAYNFDISIDEVTHHYQMRFMYIDPKEKKRIILGFKIIDDDVKAEQERHSVLEAALEAAQSANHAKTIFLNSMSHDIRTPMNAILGYTNRMEKELDNPEKIKDYIGKIKSSGDFLLTLINNVLEVARIDSGKETLDECVIDLKDKKCAVYPMLENEFEKKHQTFTAEMNIQHQYVYADIDKIREITMNLLSNAIKYTPEGGHIHQYFDEVPCTKEGYAAYVNTITDSGIGMTKEFQQHIFESFTREKDTTQSKIIGTGLGMAIVKKMVDMMGGSIEVESEIGKGSTFKVYLEHKIGEKAEVYIESQIRSSSEHSFNAKGKRILLAEDNEINAELANEILMEYGFDVDWAEDGVVCIDLLTKAPVGYYDLILMDIQMPNLNGYDATRKIRALSDKDKANIPIIAMTANAFEEDRKNALEAGMNNHIAKPIDLSKLQSILEEVLGC